MGRESLSKGTTLLGWRPRTSGCLPSPRVRSALHVVTAWPASQPLSLHPAKSWARFAQLALAHDLQAALQKQIAGELEWLQQSAKGQQKKGKARLRRYDDLVEEVRIFIFVIMISTRRFTIHVCGCKVGSAVLLSCRCSAVSSLTHA